MIADVISRLDAQVSDLSGRIEGAVQFADLMRRKALPQVTPAAYVLPLGLRGGRPEASAGAFLQDFDEMIAVMLVLRSHDRTGGRKLPELDDLITATVNAICGWGPATAPGVFVLGRGSIVSMNAGTIVYQLEFALSDQLRIFS